VLPTTNMKRPIAFLIGSICLALILAACSTAQTGGDFTSVPLEQFPQELGRGFPTVVDVMEEQQAVVGKGAPNFSFVLADGNGAELTALQGQPVVINFWATWCGPCRAEMPELVELHNENPDLTVLEVNVQEDLERVRAFAQEFEMAMPVVLDPDGVVGRAYAVRGLPATILIDSEGKVAGRWDGILTAELLAERVALLR
jgi:cytochrome c biogenesis protein CcmG, thiol:disulfide interchange protein DsbE